jgi:three-Cys-motif partner protein
MTVSVVGPWARDKLDRLEKYLSAYTTIMRKQAWCDGYVYIDAFAAAGEHKVRPSSKSAFGNELTAVATFAWEQGEQREFIAGSPRVALDVPHPFSRYVFLEKSPQRVEDLRRLERHYGDERRMIIREGDCNDYLRGQLAPNVDWARWRALVFLDPFGMQVPWETIAALARTGGVEIFLNFPVGMAIQRMLRRDPTEMTAERRRPLDEYFGSTGWFDAVYPSRRERTLFGEEDCTAKVEQSGRHLVRWYRERLQEVFPHVSKAALVRNTHGGHLYYLLLASHNRTGVKIANDVLSAGETFS